MGNVNSKLPQEEQEVLLLQEPRQKQVKRRIEKLTQKERDQLLLFKIANEGLKEEFCTKLPIVDIIDNMASVPQDQKMEIKEIEKNYGNVTAVKKLLSLATKKLLKCGWSCQLLQAVATLALKEMEEQISLNQTDLEELIKRNGIPRNSLLERLREKQRDFCSKLVCPMGNMPTGRVEESEPVPIVHPQLQVSEDHFRRNTDTTDATDATHKQKKKTKTAYEAPRISFEDITKYNVKSPKFKNRYSKWLRKQHALKLCLIGPAGSGKTTMTKRMVETWIKEEIKMAFFIPFAQIDKDDRQSLKNLLTQFLCRLHNLENPSEEEIDEAFQWILDNQEKCMLIFDGLDQSSFDISNEPIEDPDINDQFLPRDLMSFLMSRKFLPNTRIAVTSRPHSLSQFAPSIQPDIVVFLNDLLSDDAEQLMNYFLKKESAGDIMEKLRIKSPRIHQLVFNPLLLRLVAMLCNESNHDIWEYVNTTAKLFYEVVETIQSSAHHECGLDGNEVKDLNRKLAEMAFSKTIEGSVVFEQSDLERYELNSENIQDFLFGVTRRRRTSSKDNNALLVGLMQDFYFNHQSTQEFFSARYVLEQMPVVEFKKFVGKLFPRLDKNWSKDVAGVGKDSFANLRIFIIGIVNEMKNRPLGQKEILTKKDIFIKLLCEHLSQVFAWNPSRVVVKHQEQMLIDMMDFREEGVCSEIREHLKAVNFVFDYSGSSNLKAGAHREALFHFNQHFTSNVKKLWLNTKKWKDDDVRKLFISMNSILKIEKMHIKMKSRHGYECMNDFIETLPLITRKLVWDCNVRRYRRKLTKKITKFDTSTLQTQELRVKVGNYDFEPHLRVILCQDEPPQFISCLDTLTAPSCLCCCLWLPCYLCSSCFEDDDN